MTLLLTQCIGTAHAWYKVLDRDDRLIHLIYDVNPITCPLLL